MLADSDVAAPARLLRITTLAVRPVFNPRIGCSRTLSLPWSASCGAQAAMSACNAHHEVARRGAGPAPVSEVAWGCLLLSAGEMVEGDVEEELDERGRPRMAGEVGELRRHVDPVTSAWATRPRVRAWARLLTARPTMSGFTVHSGTGWAGYRGHVAGRVAVAGEDALGHRQLWPPPPRSTFATIDYCPKPRWGRVFSTPVNQQPRQN